MIPKRKTNNAAVVSTKEEESSSSSSAPNQPKNFLVRDATKPFEFSFVQYGKSVSIVVHQTAEDETWPGGALWDIGIILSRFFVELAGFRCTTGNEKSKSKATIPTRMLQSIPNTKDLTVLELGCGVGLTGIVATAVLGTQLTILTDLNAVIKKVAEPNVERNSTPCTTAGNSDGGHTNSNTAYRLTKAGKRGRIMTMPLSWGNEQDEDAVLECFRKWTKHPSKSQRTKKGKKKQQLPQNKDTDTDLGGGHPDLIIIGDVAYQQYPGAPSHFDVLLSTVLRFLGPNTVVVFGTRIRMAASADLLELFLEHMEHTACPPIEADEIDPAFRKFKHQITIHLMRKKTQNEGIRIANREQAYLRDIKPTAFRLGSA